MREKEFSIDQFYNAAYHWVLSYGPRFLIGLAVLFIGLRFIRWILNRSHEGMHQKNIDPTVKPFLASLIGVALRVLLVIGVMQIMGIELTLFTAIVGAFGVAVGLALSGTLQNFASGLLILLLKPFVVGDNILAQGLEGTITSIQIFYTLMTTYDNRSVILPNSLLSNNLIINISREGIRRLDIDYKFNNGVDIGQAKKVIGDIIDKEEACLKTPERRIGVMQLEADSFTLAINVWIAAHGYWDNKMKIQEAILQGLKDSGIRIGGL
ncbi:Ion channel protein [Mucilaginibacter sp. PPCGB 2223]|uniref:mechanosensitive ion channel family protein n=1 Tax=Mucilaginibacter sp. PPCGB 2223 TaxID=1886027 RepID=UPI00082561CE|nr:mechanosensitive ion channel domain-containing protein [Mucilaginibacter sp. PPCGB 2223]OCX54836.1 Ion channel protein [Mucilaginibacter sp. PPCGB 2223]